VKVMPVAAFGLGIVELTGRWEFVWSRRRDSNPHAFRREILSLLRLPFRHSGLAYSRTARATAARAAARPAGRHGEKAGSHQD
jgi:hypothetical protein